MLARQGEQEGAESLNRRSQRRAYNWSGFRELMQHFKTERPRIVGRPKTRMAASTTIQDIEGVRQAIVKLLNLVEMLASENRELREENQRLRDEINRLKGEQGQPQIKPNRSVSPPGTTNHSSERERHQRQAWKRSRRAEYGCDRHAGQWRE